VKWWKWAIPAAAAIAAPFTFGGSLAALGIHGGMTLGELATLGAGGAQAITGIVGANKQASANRTATAEQGREYDTTQKYLQAQADEDRRRYEQEQAMKKAAWDTYQSNRQPYRDASLAALAGYRPTPYQGPPQGQSLAQLANVRRAA
jgi:hypothetical protein